jgi:hypothetical protein
MVPLICKQMCNIQAHLIKFIPGTVATINLTVMGEKCQSTQLFDSEDSQKLKDFPNHLEIIDSPNFFKSNIFSIFSLSPSNATMDGR